MKQLPGKTAIALPHRDLGGGVYERADGGGCVGLVQVGAEPAHALVLARLDTGVEVVGVEFVDPDRYATG